MLICDLFLSLKTQGGGMHSGKQKEEYPKHVFFLIPRIKGICVKDLLTAFMIKFDEQFGQF